MGTGLLALGSVESSVVGFTGYAGRAPSEDLGRKPIWGAFVNI